MRLRNLTPAPATVTWKKRYGNKLQTFTIVVQPNSYLVFNAAALSVIQTEALKAGLTPL
jgi:hypothetical protein